MKPIRILHQQGDVLLRSLSKLPKTAKVVPAEDGKVILARGEVTGHNHALLEQEGVRLYSIEELTEEMRAWEVGTGLVLVVEKQLILPTELGHEEHGPQVIAPGVLHVGAVREYDYVGEEGKRVID